MPLLEIFRITILYFLLLLEVFLVVRIVLSWLPVKPNNIIRKYTIMLTEPMLDPTRKLLEKSIIGGRAYMLDLSPLIVFIVINYLRYFVS